MSEPESHFEALLRKAAGGSEAAVWELLDRYSSNILRTVRRHLPSALRSKVDSVDIVQSVWKSVLKKGSNLEVLTCPESLLGYILAMAKRKVLETHRLYTELPKRDIRREAAQFDVLANPHEVRKGNIHGLPDKRAGTPSAILRAQESWESARKRLGSAADLVLELRLKGHTLDEIAEHTRLSKSTIRRVLDQLAKSLEV